MLENNRLQALVTNTVTTIKLRTLAFFAPHDGEIDKFKQQVTEKTTEIDRKLAERYPERYAALKQRVVKTKSWYEQQIAEQKANPDRPLLLEQSDLRITKRMEELGKNIAQTEREVRAKIDAKLHPEAPKS